MRTIEDIFQEMVAAKNADTRLAGLNSPSATAIWGLIFYAVAVVIFATDQLHGLLRAELLAIRDAAVPGTPAWYRAKALEWQDGDVLAITDGVIAYPTQDAAARLVTRAAVTEQPDGSILIKVAAASGPLSGPQILSVQEYFRQLHFAGTIFGIISLNADQLRVESDIYFDPQIGMAATLANCEAAILKYLASLPFNSAIHVSRLTDAIQSASGVEDIDNMSLSVDSGAGFIHVARTMVPLSGWFEIDTVMPLAMTLNLVPNV